MGRRPPLNLLPLLPGVCQASNLPREIRRENTRIKVTTPETSHRSLSFLLDESFRLLSLFTPNLRVFISSFAGHTATESVSSPAHFLFSILRLNSPSSCTVASPRNVFDLYTPRLVRRSGHTKVGICPFCTCTGMEKSGSNAYR